MKWWSFDWIVVLAQWSLKLFLVLLPWQTLYLVRTGATPFESVFVSASALLLLFILGVALYIYKPKITVRAVSGVGLLLGSALFMAPDKSLAMQHCAWLFLAGGLWWLLTQDLLTKSEHIVYSTVGAIVPAGLGLWQFFAQSSFTATWLGLSFIPASLPGSPVIVGESGRWLRAFGSFPHPNIFGGYLVAILGLIFSRANEFSISNNRNWVWRFCVILLTSVLVLSFSRSALGVWILFMIFYHYKIFKTERGSELAVQVFISLLTAALTITLTWSIWSGRLGQGTISENEKVAITERFRGTELAGKIIRDNWLFGVGPGNYITTLRSVAPELKPWEIAPVHNTPMLILAEWGLLGALALGLIGYYARAKILYLLPILLLDHYLYSQWSGILVGIILILSTVYAHLRLTQPKN